MKHRSNKNLIKQFYKRSLYKSDENSISGAKADCVMVTTKTQPFFEQQQGYTFLDERMIDAYSPDKLDSRVFWREATRHFKWIPINGSMNIRSKKDLFKSARSMHHSNMQALDKAVYAHKPHAKMLEIGPGYGNVRNYIKHHHGLSNYYCIDVNPLFKYKRMFQTDGKTIPEGIPMSLDIVYSVNVFQHLSEQQRKSYFKQIAERLSADGVFIFSMFVVTKWNEHAKTRGGSLFGWRDKNNNYYSSFFNQFIRIPREEEIAKELEECGLTIGHNREMANTVMFYVRKKHVVETNFK